MARNPSVTQEAAFAILSQCIAGRTHKLARFLDGIFNEELRAVGLRNTQLTMLAVLGYMRVSAPQLGAILVMDRSTISRNLRILRQRGLVDVADHASRGAGDAGADAGPGRGERGADVFMLTTAGKRSVRQASAAWERAMERARSELGDDAVAALQRVGDSVGWLPDD